MAARSTIARETTQQKGHVNLEKVSGEKIATTAIRKLLPQTCLPSGLSRPILKRKRKWEHLIRTYLHSSHGKSLHFIREHSMFSLWTFSYVLRSTTRTCSDGRQKDGKGCSPQRCPPEGVLGIDLFEHPKGDTQKTAMALLA